MSPHCVWLVIVGGYGEFADGGGVKKPVNIFITDTNTLIMIMELGKITVIITIHFNGVHNNNDNETPTVHGLAADNKNKVYMELMIFLWNNHYNLNFNVGLSDNSKK